MPRNDWNSFAHLGLANPSMLAALQGLGLCCLVIWPLQKWNAGASGESHIFVEF